MTDTRDPRVAELVTRVVELAPPAPEFPDDVVPRPGRSRAVAVAACALAVVAGVIAVVIFHATDASPSGHKIVVVQHPSTVPSTARVVDTAPFCRAAQLGAKNGADGAAAGHHVRDVVLRNVSGSTCALQGTVAVYQYDGRGNALPGRSHEGEAYTFPAVAARRIVLRPGEYASFATEVVNIGRASCPAPARADFVLPNGAGVFAAPDVFDGCIDGMFAVTVSNIVAGRTAPSY